MLRVHFGKPMPEECDISHHSCRSNPCIRTYFIPVSSFYSFSSSFFHSCTLYSTSLTYPTYHLYGSLVYRYPFIFPFVRSFFGSCFLRFFFGGFLWGFEFNSLHFFFFLVSALHIGGFFFGLWIVLGPGRRSRSMYVYTDKYVPINTTSTLPLAGHIR